MRFDVVVVGGGHAGIEAAFAASKRVQSVLLVTMNIDMIGHMSCNPAIGGIAKGNMVREIDALGGVMGKAIDVAGIHFRMLNQSKGIAVWGNRAQADKRLYRAVVREMLESRQNLFLLQGTVKGIVVKGEGVAGVLLDSGDTVFANAVVLAMGTFLNGLGHIGLTSFPCGRTGEPPATGLTECLTGLGITSARLKTGTSPRIDGRTVDFSRMQQQPGDPEPWPFSFSTEGLPGNKACCWITRTSAQTHEIIRNSLDRSPLYSGKIRGVGPRYCPSIEDKVVRFGERETHTLFLEPEGLGLRELYLNGLSTSLPFDVQEQMVNSVPGLERAQILRPGYAIEYDFFQPLQLWPTLESRTVKGLFFAGQINGTSGYEEAGCQGLVAGANAAAQVLEEEPLVLGRETSYTGVLIDDLVSKGTNEPYRMFTSRAEYRLLLRQDNADERLMAMAAERGLVDPKVLEQRRRAWDVKKQALERLQGRNVSPEELDRAGCAFSIRQATTAAVLLKRPDVTLEFIGQLTGERIDDRDVALRLEADVKYSGFVEKQSRTVERQKKMEQMPIPQGLRYEEVEGLLTEARLKMDRIRPNTLGQASRIPGVTPADTMILATHILRTQHTHVSRETAG